MAKTKNHDVKIEKTREIASAVPVEDFGSMFDPQTVPTKQPIVFLTGQSLRDAHVEILALRVLKEPIPEHLAANDRLDICGLRACRLLMAMMNTDGVSDLGRVREYANRVIPQL